MDRATRRENSLELLITEDALIAGLHIMSLGSSEALSLWDYTEAVRATLEEAQRDGSFSFCFLPPPHPEGTTAYPCNNGKTPLASLVEARRYEKMKQVPRPL